MLKQRVLTALVLIPLTLLILFYLPADAFCFLIGLIVLGAAWEWTNLMEIKKTGWRWFYLLIIAVCLGITARIPVLYTIAASAVWWVIALLLVLLYPRASEAWGRSVTVRGIMGILVLVPCWIAVCFIRKNEATDTLLFLFILIWGADTAAYFVGKKWGKHKLAPSVSPGKSVQGFIGALVFTVILVLGVVWFLDIPMNLWAWCFGLSLLTVVFSVIGDLFESMLKRKVGLKDSGRLLPGHGGLLDRIDSLTAAAPIFVFGSLMLGMIQV